MISDRDRGVRRLVLLCQCILVTALLWAWAALICDSPSSPRLFSRHLVFNEFLLLGLLIGARLPRAGGHPTPPRLDAVCQCAFRQAGFGLGLWLLYSVASGEPQFPRGFLFSFIPLEYALLGLSHRFLPPILGALAFGRRLRQKVLLVGPRAKASQVKRWLDEHSYLGLDVLGLLSDDQQDAAKDPIPTLGRPADLENVLAAPGIVQVILVEMPAGAGLLEHYAALCDARGIRLLVVAALADRFGSRLAVFHDQGLFFFGPRREPLEDPVNRALKRALDIAISLPVVVLLFPPLYAAARFCQSLQSPGPVFFAQARDGFHNQPFQILKVRTMHLANRPPGLFLSNPDAPRLFPLGRFLRRSSLDELPQFWNVLRGEMSVVGPRPHLPSYNEEYRRFFLAAYVRSFVKPGITGLAQVRGFRGPASNADAVVARLQSDLEYLENWSLWLDGCLIARTALQVLSPPITAV